jgi:hypothetical protein
MTILVISFNNAYEITFTPNGVTSIVRYPQCRDGRGELVDYDTLPIRAQEAIYKKLRNELKAPTTHKESSPE